MKEEPMPDRLDSVPKLTVSELTSIIKTTLEGSFYNLTVEGEISGFKPASTGHWYFSLKDNGSVIGCAMWRSNIHRVGFIPKDGQRVVVKGSLSVYEPRGTYSLICTSMDPFGEGDILAMLEERKRHYAGLGYFDASCKKPLPKHPERVAVITSPTGAALQDILQITGRRNPSMDIIILPATVQGPGAAASIAARIKEVNDFLLAPVMIVGRGGGSIEDLLPFSEDSVIEASHESEIPVISAVGHETDYTICDLVADVRAATPSAAAERAVPVADEVIAYFENANLRLKNALHSMLKVKNQYLQALSSHFTPKRGENIIAGYMITVDAQRDRLLAAYRRTLSRYNTAYEKNAAALYAFNPLALLSRGYAAVYKDGKNINSVSEIQSSDLLTLLFSDGKVTARVTETESNEKEQCLK